MEITVENIYCNVTVSSHDLEAKLAKQPGIVSELQKAFDTATNETVRGQYATQLLREKTILHAMRRLAVLTVLRT